MSDDIAVRVTIRGRVQGVGFRDWTEHRARKRALRGWVRNRRDGSVEALFAGPDEAVREMIAACHRGPGPAHVEAIVEAPADPADAPAPFAWRETA